ncbi:uncharacterized protein HMPREF1120_04001 [Exophiala dermatitidis NIH/UT8656]|uniref:Uncharacterized protein n=1 Tax=Exophiala dermatitidis (strain ATCC 34100 / CBS 525.76 / NIH/UT8656) TaxID=858893 RepID=H6BVF7_EXODN|nr:uncharacterized protein HMPREF1120_04001 [Exophiala dermatitidis NIH/UT8656]EHY55887.1 hypothetical protein HMPREF1120_04001 [Exophiala dermatitidis NIH/UT8656]
MKVSRLGYSRTQNPEDRTLAVPILKAESLLDAVLTLHNRTKLNQALVFSFISDSARPEPPSSLLSIVRSAVYLQCCWSCHLCYISELTASKLQWPSIMFEVQRLSPRMRTSAAGCSVQDEDL